MSKERTKNIQVIDGAENCTYSVFSATPDVFRQLFPDRTDVEFAEDVFSRLGDERARALLAELWEHPVGKKRVRGIHGTLFYQLSRRKRFFPTKRESEMVASPGGSHDGELKAGKRVGSARGKRTG